MKLLPLGTVIRLNNYKLCIIGYVSVENKLKSPLSYLVVSYPLGFTNIDKVFIIPYDMEFEIIAGGYKTEASEKILNTLETGVQMLDKVPQEQIMKFMDMYEKVMLSTKGAAEK